MVSPEMSLNTLLFAAEFLDRSDESLTAQATTVTVPLLMTPRVGDHVENHATCVTADTAAPMVIAMSKRTHATEHANILKRSRKRNGVSNAHRAGGHLGKGGNPVYPSNRIRSTSVVDKIRGTPEYSDGSTSTNGLDIWRYDHNDKEKQRRATIRQCFTELKNEITDYTPDSLMAPVRGTDRVSDFAVLQRAQQFIGKLQKEQMIFSETKSQLMVARMEFVQRLEVISGRLSVPMKFDAFRNIPMASDKIKIEERTPFRNRAERRSTKKPRSEPIPKVKLDIKMPSFPSTMIHFNRLEPEKMITHKNELHEKWVDDEITAATSSHQNSVDSVVVPSGEFSIDIVDHVAPIDTYISTDGTALEEPFITPANDEPFITPANDEPFITPANDEPFITPANDEPFITLANDEQEIDVETVTQDDSQIYINLNDHTDNVQSYVFFPLDQSNVIVEFVDPGSGDRRCIQLPNTKSVRDEGLTINTSS